MWETTLVWETREDVWYRHVRNYGRCLISSCEKLWKMSDTVMWETTLVWVTMEDVWYRHVRNWKMYIVMWETMEDVWYHHVRNYSCVRNYGRCLIQWKWERCLILSYDKGIQAWWSSTTVEGKWKGIVIFCPQWVVIFLICSYAMVDPFSYIINIQTNVHTTWPNWHTFNVKT